MRWMDNMKKDKKYFVDVRVQFSVSISASNKKEAIELVKDIFEQDHNLDLGDNEIVEVTEQK